MHGHLYGCVSRVRFARVSCPWLTFVCVPAPPVSFYRYCTLPAPWTQTSVVHGNGWLLNVGVPAWPEESPTLDQQVLWRREAREMQVLKEHKIQPSDKVSVEKVEALLNSVLRELQKEKTRARSVEETLRKMESAAQQQEAQSTAVAALAQISALQAELHRLAQQQHVAAEATANRLSALESGVGGRSTCGGRTSGGAGSEKYREPPPLHAPPPKHREPPTVGSSAMTASSQTALEQLEARMASLESRTAIATVTATSAASAAEGSAAAVAAMRARMELVASEGSRESRELHAALETILSRVEAQVQTQLALRTQAIEEACLQAATKAANQTAMGAATSIAAKAAAAMGSATASGAAAHCDAVEARQKSSEARAEARLLELGEHLKALEKALEQSQREGTSKLGRQLEASLVGRVTDATDAIQKASPPWVSCESAAERAAEAAAAKAAAAAARHEAAAAKEAAAASAQEAAATQVKLERLEARVEWLEAAQAHAQRRSKDERAAPEPRVEGVPEAMVDLKAQLLKMNSRVDETNSRVDETNSRVDETYSRVEELSQAVAMAAQEGRAASRAAAAATSAMAARGESAAGLAADARLPLERRCQVLETTVEALRGSTLGVDRRGSGHGVHWSDGTVGSLDEARLEAALRPKLNRSEWATLREELLADVHKLLHQATAPRPPPPLPSQQLNARLGASREAFPEAAAPAPMDAEAESTRLRLQSRTVSEHFALGGTDGRLYRGAATGVVQEWVLEKEEYSRERPDTAAPTIGVSSTLRMRPVSASAGSAAKRPSSAGARALYRHSSIATACIPSTQAQAHASAAFSRRAATPGVHTLGP